MGVGKATYLWTRPPILNPDLDCIRLKRKETCISRDRIIRNYNKGCPWLGCTNNKTFIVTVFVHGGGGRLLDSRRRRSPPPLRLIRHRLPRVNSPQWESSTVRMLLVLVTVLVKLWGWRVGVEFFPGKNLRCAARIAPGTSPLWPRRLMNVGNRKGRPRYLSCFRSNVVHEVKIPPPNRAKWKLWC
jgi:hypothetical protein